MQKSRRRKGQPGQAPESPGGSSPAGRRLAARVWAWIAANPLPIAGALAAVHLLLAVLVLIPAPHAGGDNAVYITVARSLLERGDYLSLHVPGEPPHTQYPPFFPALLALAMAVGLQPWVQLKLVVAATSAVAVGFSYLWMHRRRRFGAAVGIGLLLAISPGVLEHTRWILSDVPFWALAMIALWGFERSRPVTRRGPLILAIAALLLAYLTRSAGLPLVVAAAAWLAWRRRWPALAGLTLSFLPIALGWWAWGRAHGTGIYATQFWLVNPYAPELGTIGAGGMIGRMLDNIGRYLVVHLPILLSGGAAALMLPISLLVGGFALYGWVRRLRRAPTVAEFFFPLYGGLILIWPAVWAGERFLLPILPLILFYAGDGLARAVRRVRPDATALAGAAATVMLLASGVTALARQVEIGLHCSRVYSAGDRFGCTPPTFREFMELGEWSRDALPAGSVVLSRKPSLFYVASGFPGDYYPLSANADSLFARAERTGARYVVFDRLDAMADAYLAPILLGRPDAFCIVTATTATSTVLFGIAEDGASVIAREEPPDAEEINFPVCDVRYWRDEATRLQHHGGG
jgi:hypothetical protein